MKYVESGTFATRKSLHIFQEKINTRVCAQKFREIEEQEHDDSHISNFFEDFQ